MFAIGIVTILAVPLEPLKQVTEVLARVKNEGAGCPTLTLAENTQPFVSVTVQV